MHLQPPNLQIRRPGSLRRRLVHLTSYLLTASATGLVAWAIGRAPDRDPDIVNTNARSAVVRIAVIVTNALGDGTPVSFNTNFGSGTIVGVQRDSAGNGGWVAILTCDHGVGSLLVNPTLRVRTNQTYQIGLGNGTTFPPGKLVNPTNGISTNNVRVLRFPADTNGVRPDLCVIGYYLPDVRNVGVLPVAGLTLSTNLQRVLVAGYGDPAQLRVSTVSRGAVTNGQVLYRIVTPNEDGAAYGTNRFGYTYVGGLKVTNLVIDTGTYSYFGLANPFLAGRTPSNTFTYVSSYYFNADSGGPVLSYSGGNIVAVAGVHTASQTLGSNLQPGGYVYAAGGQLSLDVHVGPYLSYITNAVYAVTNRSAYTNTTPAVPPSPTSKPMVEPGPEKATPSLNRPYRPAPLMGRSGEVEVPIDPTGGEAQGEPGAAGGPIIEDPDEGSTSISGMPESQIADNSTAVISLGDKPDSDPEGQAASDIADPPGPDHAPDQLETLDFATIDAAAWHFNPAPPESSTSDNDPFANNPDTTSVDSVSVEAVVNDSVDQPPAPNAADALQDSRD